MIRTLAFGMLNNLLLTLSIHKDAESIILHSRATRVGGATSGIVVGVRLCAVSFGHHFTESLDVAFHHILWCLLGLPDDHYGEAGSKFAGLTHMHERLKFALHPLQVLIGTRMFGTRLDLSSRDSVSYPFGLHIAPWIRPYHCNNLAPQTRLVHLC